MLQKTAAMDIKKKRKVFNALLAVGQMMDAKAHILDGYGVSSTLDLTDKQLDELIDRIRSIIDRKKTVVPKEMREWRHKCLRMMTKCSVNTNDWNSVNAFMEDKKICGRHLYELNLQELVILHRKLHNVALRKKEKQEEIV